jgi:prevent-host-death family protein
MKATILDLRYRMKDVLEAVDRGETVTVFHRGKAKARLVPIETKPARSKLRADEAFGLWKDRADQFWSIVGPASPNRQLRKAIQQAIAAEREENDVGVLGGKRSNSHPRRRPGKSLRK